MKKVLLLFFFLSFTTFSQEIEYDRAAFYLKNNQIEEATSSIQTAIRKAKNNKSKYYLMYANVLKFQNITDSSFYYITKAEKDYQSRNIEDSLLYTYTLKTEFYRYLAEKKKAETSLLNIEKFNLQKIKNKDIVAYALNRKMAILNGYHDGSKDTLEIVKQIAKQIINLEKQIKNKEVIAYTLNEVAQIEDYKGDKNKAFAKYETALNYAQKHQLLNPEIDISFNLAKLHATFKKDNKKAVELLERLITKVEEGSNVRQKFSLFLQIKEYYRETNQLKKALFAADKVYKYTQDMNNQEAYFKLNVVEKKFDLAEKEKQIQVHENEIKIQNLEIANSRKKFWLVFIIFILTTIGVFTLTYFFKREQKSNKQLRVLSDENEFLLSEAHHRINNNLQLITILINNQLDKSTHSERIEFKKIISKISSIATLHRHLYKSNDKKNIEIKDYLTDIYSNFSELFKQNDIISNFEVSSFKINIDQAMYIGLILTELYINSIKHAFYDQAYKQIDFNLTIEKNQIILNYQDNGQLIKGKPMPKPSLIHQLCRQLEVECSIKTTNGFQISFIKLIE
ncbi:tetratricopeptide repeat-containing sensor histidine kinase [Flavobacterium sp.]|uniref:tetratricopeptide repeat-containing sensor histidine kinase n=1 Tax=Flavobacterium sp. TaxID=239 RepID=UPI003D2DD184